MPQGGIDKGEKPWATARREVEEETGIPPHLVERIAAASERLKDDLPARAPRQIMGRQMAGPGPGLVPVPVPRRTATSTSRPNIPNSANGSGSSPRCFPNCIVPFKRDLYRQLLSRVRQPELN